MQPSVYWIPDQHCGPLAIIGRPRGGEWLEDELTALHGQGFRAIVCLLTTGEVLRLGLEREAEFCGALGMELVSFPIYDRDAPDSIRATAVLVSRLRQLLAEGQPVGVHCRSSIGRSSVVAACILVDSGCDPITAFQEIATARGVEVPDIDRQRTWVEEYARRPKWADDDGGW